MENKTFYDIQKEEYKKNVIIKKVKISEGWNWYNFKIKIIDNNRIIKKHTLKSYFITAPTEKELDSKIKNELAYYIHTRIGNKCADYVVKKYNEKLVEKEGK
jgi:hypothetical protein